MGGRYMKDSCIKAGKSLAGYDEDSQQSFRSDNRAC